MAGYFGSRIATQMPSAARLVPPKVLEGYRPDYPESEGARRESGYAVILCTIGVDGRVQDFEIESTSNPAFAFEAMRR